jgi:BlaI family transcriptional regulator, penicillinase repressor
MKKQKIHRLGDLQLKILKILWETGSATVSEVHDRLRSEELAYTTVATMLRKMEARGLVKHSADGRTFIYEACVDAGAVSKGMSEHLLERLFEGKLADLVSHLLTVREVSREELTALEKLIAERKKQK